ncbi:MAG: hypothetical protein M3466_00285, partial [Gemmatimonadota bacterium]|nr:hypothetical protein [Gemmatimonadota bacterium]
MTRAIERNLRTIPWWAILYIVMFAGIGLISAFTDLRGSKRAFWHVALDVASAAGLILLMVGRWHQHLVAPLGAWAAAMFAAIVTWDVYSTKLDLSELDHDSELTHRQNEAANWVGILAGGAVAAPGYALALFSV